MLNVRFGPGPCYGHRGTWYARLLRRGGACAWVLIKRTKTGTDSTAVIWAVDLVGMVKMNPAMRRGSRFPVR